VITEAKIFVLACLAVATTGLGFCQTWNVSYHQPKYKSRHSYVATKRKPDKPAPAPAPSPVATPAPHVNISSNSMSSHDSYLVHPDGRWEWVQPQESHKQEPAKHRGGSF